MEVREALARAEKAAEANDLDAAAHYAEAVICAQPGNSHAMYLLGSIFSMGGQNGVAIPLLLRSIEEKPTAAAINNLAVCFRQEGQENLAQTFYEASLQLDDKNAETWSNYAGAFINAGAPARALQAANRAIEINPGLASAHHHKALALLELGEWEEGWKEYLWRKKIKEFTPRSYPWPQWEGQDVKRLLIHGEQGIGDEILFMQWLQYVPAEQIAVECTPRMKSVFENSFPSVRFYGTEQEVLESGEQFDAVCAMADLPHLTKQTLPEWHAPYLESSKPGYRLRLRQLGLEPHIGISWQGGLKRTHANIRNAPLNYWKELVANFPGTFVSLQYGPKGAEEAAELGIPHLQEAIDDLDEMQALIGSLDCVVTMNNTTVHQAGAAGVRCVTLTPSKPAWRYQLDGESMPWYPSVTQCRQVGDDWAPAFAAARQHLRRFFA